MNLQEINDTFDSIADAFIHEVGLSHDRYLTSLEEYAAKIGTIPEPHRSMVLSRHAQRISEGMRDIQRSKELRSENS